MSWELVQKHGRPLTFDECANRMGSYVLVDMSSESEERYARVRIVNTGTDPAGEDYINYKSEGRRNWGIVRRYAMARKPVFYEEAEECRS